MDSCFSGLNAHSLTSSDRDAGASHSAIASPKAARVAVRTARCQDLNALAEVLTHSFHPPIGLMAWAYPLLKLGIHEDLRCRLQEGSPHYLCLAAVVSQYPIHAKTNENAAASPERDRSVKSAATDCWEEVAGTVEIAVRSSGIIGATQYAYISNLAVSQRYRRQGIARKLILSCEPAARDWGFREIYLHVLEDNERARQLYSSSGYRLYRVEPSLGSLLFNRPRRLLLHKPLQCS